MKKKTLKDVTGVELVELLDATPVDRKNKVIKALNIAIKWLMDNDKITDYINVIIPATVTKIVNEVDVTDEEILNICNEMNIAFENFDPKVYPNLKDPEAEFVTNFCMNKINQLKKLL